MNSYFLCIFKIAYAFSLILFYFSVSFDILISLLAKQKQYKTLNTFYPPFIQLNVAKSYL